MKKEYLLSQLNFKSFYTALLPSLKAGRNGQALGLCPFHNDHHPSLSVNLDNGKWYCHPCGKGGDVFSFYMKLKGVDFKTALKEIAEMQGISENSIKQTVMATFIYHDADGNELYRKERLEPGRDGRSKEFVFKHRINGNLEYGRGGDPVLYNLPEVLKAKEVIIVEGEGKVDLLKKWGLVATCLDAGANSKWRDEYTEILKGKEKVVILTDNDEPGRKFVYRIASELHGKVVSLKVVDLPGLDEKGDIIDWSEIDGNDKDKLSNIIKAEEEWIPTVEEEVKENDKSESQEKPQQQAAKLLELTSDLELFHDEHKEPFTFIDGKVIFISSNEFKELLSYQFYKSEKKAPSSEALNQSVSVMKSKAKFEGSMRTLHVRIAELDGKLYYDLGNGKAIQTSVKGWNVVDAPVLFRRYSHQQEQVLAVSGGDPWELLDLINVSKDNDDHILLMVLIISNFIPGFSHPILCLYGSQGSGKTSSSKIVKSLCDPSSADVLITPKNRGDLIQAISHHHVCFFDNLSNISKDMSDILCCACTGGGFPKRKLYTDDEDIILKVKRCVGISGINQLIVKPDLLERSILLQLEKIDNANRRTEKDIKESFADKLPYILGGIFDVLVKVMAIYPGLQLDRLPRMADFCKYGYAIAEALGIGGKKFLDAYQSNINRQNEEVIQGNTLAQAVISLMRDREVWSGTVGEVYKELRGLIDDDNSRDDHTFPKYPNKLRKFLDKIKANLLDRGISYNIGTHGSSGVPMTFKKIENVSSLSSASSDTSSINDLQTDDKMKIPDDLFKFDEDTLTMPDDTIKTPSSGILNNNNNYDDSDDGEDKNATYLPEVIDVEEIL